MADNNNSQFIVEGASLTRSPGFTREDYPYWKDKIEIKITNKNKREQSLKVNKRKKENWIKKIK